MVPGEKQALLRATVMELVAKGPASASPPGTEPGSGDAGLGAGSHTGHPCSGSISPCFPGGAMGLPALPVLLPPHPGEQHGGRGAICGSLLYKVL